MAKKHYLCSPKYILSDCTIVENIALGQNIHDIDYKKIEKVSKISQLNNDIEGGKFNLNTLVGERGIRLSGGQKQKNWDS